MTRLGGRSLAVQIPVPHAKLLFSLRVPSVRICLKGFTVLLLQPFSHSLPTALSHSRPPPVYITAFTASPLTDSSLILLLVDISQLDAQHILNLLYRDIRWGLTSPGRSISQSSKLLHGGVTDNSPDKTHTSHPSTCTLHTHSTAHFIRIQPHASHPSNHSTHPTTAQWVTALRLAAQWVTILRLTAQ